MTPLALESEKFQPTGNIAGRGAKNQLGRPDMDPLTVLVREAVQNSWDARLSESSAVEMAFDL